MIFRSIIHTGVTSLLAGAALTALAAAKPADDPAASNDVVVKMPSNMKK